MTRWGSENVVCRREPSWAYQQGEARKEEIAGRVVDNVYLTGVEARLQLRERHIELEDGGVPFGSAELVGFDHRRLVGFDLAAEKGNAGEKFRAAVILGFTFRRRLVHLVIKVQMLSRRKDVGDAGDQLGTIAHQRALGFALACGRNLV